MTKMTEAATKNQEIDIFALLHEVKTNIWLILGIVSLSMVIGVLYCKRLLPQYQAHVLLQIESKQPGLAQAATAQQFLLGGRNGESSATQIALIQSSFILRPVIEKLHLDIVAAPERRSRWLDFFQSKQSYKVTIDELVVPQKLINQALKLQLTAPGEMSFFDDKGRLLLKGRIGKRLSTRDKRIQITVKAVHAPVGTIFRVVKASESSVIANIIARLKIIESTGSFKEGTGIVDIALTGTNVQEVIQTLNMIADMTREKDAQKKAEEASQTLGFLYHQLPLNKKLLDKAEEAFNQYRAKSGKIDIKLQTQFYLNQLTALDTELAKLRIKKIQMLQKYTKKHPRMIALETQIQALNTQRNSLEREIKTLPASDQVALNLMGDMKVKKTLYMILLNKIQELRVMKAGTVSSVRVLSYAQLPDHALPRKRATIGFMSILIGLVFSALIIVMRKNFDKRIFDPHWAEKKLNVPNLAILPFSEEQSTKNKRDASAEKLFLLAHENPKSLTVEAMRSLRTSLQVGLLTARNNVVSILGVTPGVGKSFTSCNLAYLLAAAGKRVVLIDGDLRRGTVHKYFNVPASPGLAEVLQSTRTSAEVLQTSEENSNLCFMPRGVYPKDPSELLMSEYFKTCINSLSQQFDVVIIDTPPALLVTDAVVVCGLSGVNYLVLGAGSHEAEDIEMVLKRFDAADVQIHGTIFNFNRMERKHRLHGGAYGSYGRYGRYGKYKQYQYYYDDAAENK